VTALETVTPPSPRRDTSSAIALTQSQPRGNCDPDTSSATLSGHGSAHCAAEANPMNFTPIELLAIQAGVSLRTVYRDVKAGVLRTQKIDGKTMLKAEHAAKYVEQRKAVAEAISRLGRAV
jgi:hypothetical protein